MDNLDKKDKWATEWDGVMQSMEKMTQALVKAEKLVRDKLNKGVLDKASNGTKGDHLSSGSFGDVYGMKDAKGSPLPLVGKTAKGAQGEIELKKEAETYDAIGHHKNVVTCYGITKVDKEDTLVMEQIKGGKIQETFNKLDEAYKSGKVSHEEYWGLTQHITRGTLEGLAHLETKGFTHNDIKEDNVMIDATTLEAKLIDVGKVAKIGEGSERGHELYAAPEKAAKDAKEVGQVPSHANQDSYSTGQMLHKRGEGAYSLSGQGTMKDAGGLAAHFQPKGKAQTAMKGITGKDAQDTEGMEILTPTKPGPEAAKPGKYAEGMQTDYVQLLNALMHPDERNRLSPQEALNDPSLRLLQEPILSPEKVRAVFDKINTPEEKTEDKYGNKSKEAVKKMSKHFETISKLNSASEKESPEALGAYREAVEYVGGLNKELNDLKGHRSSLQMKRDKLDKSLQTERVAWQKTRVEYIAKQKQNVEKLKKEVEETNKKLEQEKTGANDPSAIESLQRVIDNHTYAIQRDGKEIMELEKNPAKNPIEVMQMQNKSTVLPEFEETEKKLAEFNKDWFTNFESTVQKLSTQLADMYKFAKKRATGTQLPEPPQNPQLKPIPKQS